MSSSLQEQLLKAGLVSKEQVSKKRQSDKQRNKAPKKKRAQSAKGAAAGDGYEHAQKLREQQAAKRQADRRLNEERQAIKANREARQRARQMARKVCQNVDDGEVAFHFVRDAAVKRVYVTEAQRDALSAGQLAVVSPTETHFIVTPADAEQITAVYPDCFVFRADAEKAAGETSDSTDPDDPYAAYQVPDDLTW